MKLLKKGKAAFILFLCVLLAVPAIFTASAFEARTTAPQSSNPYFYSSMNPFYSWGLAGQCTWYAYGRAYEILGSAPKLSQHAASGWWSYNKANGCYPYGSTPKVGAVVCYSGHVAVVEAISGGSVIVSEGNYSGMSFKYGRNVTSAIGQTLYGYIYILDGSGTPERDTTKKVTTEKETTEKPTTEKITTEKATTEKVTVTETTEAETETTLAEDETALTDTTDITSTTRRNEESGEQIVDSDEPAPAVPVKSLSLNKSHLAVAVNSDVQLTGAILPADANAEITWESTNPMVATVDSNGLVKTISDGKAVIIASVGSLTSRCVIDVSDTNESLKNIVLSANSLELSVDERNVLDCALSPEGAVNVDIAWSSSNEKVATVNAEGLVTAKSAGTCTIICKDVISGIEASCPVNVKKDVSSSFFGMITVFANFSAKIISAFANFLNLFSAR